jgi:hypothetical protein
VVSAQDISYELHYSGWVELRERIRNRRERTGNRKSWKRKEERLMKKKTMNKEKKTKSG